MRAELVRQNKASLYAQEITAMSEYGLTKSQILEESKSYIEAEGICLKEIYKSQELYMHCEHVAALAIALGAMYRLDMHTLILLGMGGYLHDIGKSQIAKQIMEKPDGLSDNERQLIQAHPTIGFRILQPYQFPKEVKDMVLYHHEKLDGSGYPTGCRELPLTVQLVTAADIYDAMQAKRCYHDRHTKTEALQMIRTERGLNQTAIRLLEKEEE